MLVFDVETNGFLDELTTVHCVNMVDRVTGDRLRFNDYAGRMALAVPPNGSLKEGLKRLEEAPSIGGHNIINFDIPAIQKVHPWFTPKGEVHDSLTYSRLLWTDLKNIDFRAIKRRKRPPEWEKGCRYGDRYGSCTGSHSLAAWGFRLGDYKGDFAGPFDTFTPEMDDYCAQDVEVNVKLFEKIEAEGYSTDSLKLETKVAQIIDLQHKHGVLFDVAAAENLAGEMTAEIADLETKLKASFKPWYAPTVVKGVIVEKTPTRKVWLQAVTDDGEIVKRSVDAGWSHCPVKRVEFEPGSRDKIADRLIKLFGWEPQEFTPTGKPKVDETTLDALDYPEAMLIKEYLALSKRLGFLATGDKALLKLVDKDGRIRGRVNSNGAVTGRMTHNSPNLAQVPKVKPGPDGEPLRGMAGGYGYELRSLFIAPKGKVLVGVDAEGLELRMLAHYMGAYDDGAYAETVVQGKKSEGTDVHTVNQQLVGLNQRDNAKTWKYAYLYGAGNFKLGATEFEDMGDNRRATFNARYPGGKDRVNALARLGGKGRKKIEEGLPALGKLQDQVKETARKRKFLRSLDGRRLHVRGMHSSLNTLLQGGGAIVMKKALVIAYDTFIERGWEFGREFAFVLNVHDEFQIEAEESLAKEIGQIAADAIRLAGEAYSLRCPLAGSQDIGRSWAETH